MKRCPKPVPNSAAELMTSLLCSGWKGTKALVELQLRMIGAVQCSSVPFHDRDDT